MLLASQSEHRTEYRNFNFQLAVVELSPREFEQFSKVKVSSVYTDDGRKCGFHLGVSRRSRKGSVAQHWSLKWKSPLFHGWLQTSWCQWNLLCSLSGITDLTKKYFDSLSLKTTWLQGNLLPVTLGHLGDCHLRYLILTPLLGKVCLLPSPQARL